MPGVFLQDFTINQSFDISFSYRYSEEYEWGMRKWVPSLSKDNCELCDQTVCSGAGKPKSPDTVACLRVDRVKRPILYPLYLLISLLYKIKPYFPPIMALGYFTAIVDIVKMTKLFRRVKPDILHINNGGYPGAMSCNSAAIAGRLAGIPVITYFICSTTRNPWWFKPVTWIVRRSVITFISASKHLRNNSSFLRKRDKETSWNSTWQTISNTMIPFEPQQKEEVREKLGIPQDEVVFLCMGDLVERKGFYRAIDAFSQMDEIGTPRSLLIIGEGPEEWFLRERAKSKEKGIYRIITDIGLIHPYSIVNACDVLVVPSEEEEDWPNVILISMMYGKPVIVSNILGFHEMVEHGHNGHLANTTNDFSVWMETMLKENERVSMGQRAQARFDQRYRLDKIIGKYMELWNG